MLAHPQTGGPEKALYVELYGRNSSTCAIVERGASVSDERLDEYELTGREDGSVQIWWELPPRVTGKKVWKWEEGDLRVWDNRCTIHERAAGRRVGPSLLRS